MDTITSLSDSYKDIIPASEIHDFLSNIHDILDKVVSKIGW